MKRSLLEEASRLTPMPEAEEHEAAERRHRAGAKGLVRFGADVVEQEAEARHMRGDERKRVGVEVEQGMEIGR